MKDLSKIKLRFGRHKGKMLKDVPDNYLAWAIRENALKGRAMIYAKIKTNYPKSTWKVTVEDSVNGDGIYLIEAYTFDDAINECKRKHKIQSTQSFCGTSYSAVELGINQGIQGNHKILKPCPAKNAAIAGSRKKV